MDLVTRKSIEGIFRLLIIMGLILFLPAWTIRYWQAWLYLAVFFISVCYITLSLIKHDKQLLERRLSAGPKSEKQKSQKIIQTIASVFSIGIILVPGFDFRLHWSLVPICTIFLSDLMILVGFIIVHEVFKENSFTSATVKVETDQTVISTGLYGIVRHPMYFGALIIIVFTPIALGSFWALLFTLPLFFVIIARLLDEECYLSRYLKGYNEYCQKVKHHLIPFIW